MTAAVAAGFFPPKGMRVPRLKGGMVAEAGAAVVATGTDCSITAKCACWF